jgi:hypothetical protein
VDIKDYLYAIRRRLWLPIVLPLAAALLTAGFIYIQPEKYQATATVIVPALSAKGYSTSAVIQYFSSYKDVLISAPVVDKVANVTGESKSNLASGLTASTTTASSNIIQVTYVGPNKNTVKDVARIAAVSALDALMGPQVSAAQTEVANSELAMKDANQKIADFASTAGPNNIPPAPGLLPEETYKIQELVLSQLEVNLQLATLANDKPRIRGLTILVVQRNGVLAGLEAQVVMWKSLSQAQTSAQAENDRAHINLNAAFSELTSDGDPRSVVAQFSGHVSRVPEILRAAGVAAGVALLLSLAYIVFMEFIHPAAPSAVSGWPLAIFPGRRSRVRVPGGITKADVSGQAPGPPLTGATGLRRTRGRMQAGVRTNVDVQEQAPGPPTAGPAEAERSNGEL